MGLLIEVLNYQKYKIESKVRGQIAQVLRNDPQASTLSLSMKLRMKVMFIYMMILFISYHLMLAVMTFNIGIFVAGIAGLSIGYIMQMIYTKTGESDSKLFYDPTIDKCCSQLD